MSPSKESNMNRLLTTLLLAAGTAHGQIDNPPTSVNIVDATATGRAVLTATNTAAAQVAILGTNADIFSSSGLTGISLSEGQTKLLHAISFPYLGGATAAAATRTNLGLGLPALTNTSNVTTMRALAGSTNTNQPYSGTLVFEDYQNQIVTFTVSNGIMLNATIQGP
jgi:hypothetical protein